MERSERKPRGPRSSSGQAAVDYLALVGVAAVVVGGLLATTVGDNVAIAAKQQVCRVVTAGKGDCPGPDNDVTTQSGSGSEQKGGPQPGDDKGDKKGDDKNKDKNKGKGDKKGSPPPSVCFDPKQRSSKSDVKIPGNGPASQAAAWGASQIANLIIDKIDNEKHKEERVQKALDDLAYCLPDYNIVIAKPHEGNLQEMDGAALIDTVEISGDTYRIYAFKKGKFTWSEDADLGWKNRGFRGNFKVSEDRRTVTFDELPHPKRKEGWKPGDQECQIEGKDLPDRSRYYNMYHPWKEEQSATMVRMLLNDVRRCFPDYNVVVMHSEQRSHWVDEPDSFIYHGRVRMNSPRDTGDDGNNIRSGRAVFDFYVFDKGTFKNDGDGGDINWAFYGNFDRDGMTVSFEPPEPADMSADPGPEGTEKVHFNDGTPKYTDGGPYPGTDYSGEVPKDDDKLNQSLIEEYSRAFPDKNILVAKSFNDLQFTYVSGLEHLAEVDGVDVFAIDEGTVKNNGDGGWKNWGFSGKYERGKDKKTVTFSSH